jgi:hypothetical protein
VREFGSQGRVRRREGKCGEWVASEWSPPSYFLCGSHANAPDEPLWVGDGRGLPDIVSGIAQCRHQFRVPGVRPFCPPYPKAHSKGHSGSLVKMLIVLSQVLTQQILHCE